MLALNSAVIHILIFRKSENRNFVTQIRNAESITENRNDYAKIVRVGRYVNMFTVIILIKCGLTRLHILDHLYVFMQT